MEENKRKVECPYCGSTQNVQYTQEALCRGVYIRCRARHCKKIFEIKLGNTDKK